MFLLFKGDFFFEGGGCCLQSMYSNSDVPPTHTFFSQQCRDLRDLSSPFGGGTQDLAVEALSSTGPPGNFLPSLFLLSFVSCLVYSIQTSLSNNKFMFTFKFYFQILGGAQNITPSV